MKVGILGGGQLARMIIESGSKFGFEFMILSKEYNSPAGLLTPNEFVGDWNYEESLRKFSDACDILTLENEFIDYKQIAVVEHTGKKVFPSSEVVRLVQDKLLQKETLKKIEVPVANFCSVKNQDEIIGFAKTNGYPVVLKTRTMGYDGKGNYTIESESDIENALQKLTGRGQLMCEQFIHFEKEIATQLVRNVEGEVHVYEVVETLQKDHVCNLVLAERNRFKSISGRVRDIAEKISGEINYVGTMGIEMFLSDDEILVNELAPRVHNSGHYTIEGCYTSQFENHLRAVTNLPLGNVSMRENDAVMINILGEREGPAELTGIGDVLASDKTFLHIYGKKETRMGRKMGHITMLGNNISELVKSANTARSQIDI